MHGSPGWQLARGLSTAPSDVLIHKKTVDSFHETELGIVLKNHGVSRLIICGLQSEFCVDTTTRRALALGYPVTLVADGHTTIDNTALKAAQISAHHNETLSHITSFGPRVTVVSASEIHVSSDASSVD